MDSFLSLCTAFKRHSLQKQTFTENKWNLYLLMKRNGHYPSAKFFFTGQDIQLKIKRRRLNEKKYFVGIKTEKGENIVRVPASTGKYFSINGWTTRSTHEFSWNDTLPKSQSRINFDWGFIRTNFGERPTYWSLFFKTLNQQEMSYSSESITTLSRRFYAKTCTKQIKLTKVQ